MGDTQRVHYSGRWGSGIVVVCLYVNVPELKPRGSRSRGWEVGVSSRFPSTVQIIVIDTDAVLPATPPAAPRLRVF